MPRLQNRVPVSGRIILLVDDDLEYLAATQRLLEREGHQVLAASSGQQALRLLRDTQVDLLLLDYFMPGFNGEAVVTELRQFNQLVQVILQTGYASEQPPRELMRRFDIQGYFDKSDGPEKLLLWTDVGLKAAQTVQLLEKSRQGLRYVLNVTPALHKIQPQEDLLHGLLAQMCGLIGSAAPPAATSAPASDGPPAPPAPAPVPGAATGCVAMLDEGGVLVIRAGSGPYVPGQPLPNCLPPAQQRLVSIALEQAAIRSDERFTVVPLQLRQSMLGVICVDRPVGSAAEMELLGIFANQAAVAIQNLQLYAIATLDPLTGAYVRRFLEIWLLRELRAAFRSPKPLAVLMADLDGLKQINDTAGHLAGDQALAMMGRVLRQATRGSDVVGRFGGDEFVVLLPDTAAAGGLRVGERLLESLRGQSVSGPDGPLPVRCSVGLVVLQPPALDTAVPPGPMSGDYFQGMAQLVIQQADQALYRAKQIHAGQLVAAPALAWAPAANLAPPQPTSASTFTSS